MYVLTFAGLTPARAPTFDELRAAETLHRRARSFVAYRGLAAACLIDPGIREAVLDDDNSVPNVGAQIEELWPGQV